MSEPTGSPVASGVNVGGDRPLEIDEVAVDRMRTVAYLLDDSIQIPGTNIRIGLDPILGILPGAGDLATAALSMYIVVESARLGVPTATLLRMLVNIAIDAFVGSVPVVGDLIDARFKANRRNVDLALRALATHPP